jgi:hypothetical protein
MRLSNTSIALLAVATLDLATTNAQVLEWARSFGSIGTDQGSMGVDATGNVYTAGWFEGTADLDPGAGNTTLTSFGEDDIYVQKLDASGSLLWVKQIGTPADDRVNAIEVDGSAYVYTTGYFSGTTDFDTGPGDNTLTSAGYGDIFVQKMDASGNSLWARSFGGSQGDEGFEIHVDGSGNVYTIGYFAGTADLDPGPAAYLLTSQGNRDVFIQKMDGSGNFLWAKSFGGPGEDFGYSVVVDASGNVITTGRFEGTVDFDPGAGTSISTSEGSGDIFIEKLDPSGDLIWMRTFGDLFADCGYSVAVDGNGATYTVGYFEGTVDLDPGIGTVELTSTAANDLFIQKLDASGDLVWARSIGDAGDDAAISIALDGDGDLYATGWFQGAEVDFGPGVGINVLENTGGYDAFVMKFDPSGNTIWARSIGGASGIDLALSVDIDAAGGVYTAGVFEGTVDLDPGSGVSNLTSAGGKDVFVQKMSEATTGLHPSGPGINVSVSPNTFKDVVTISSQQTMHDVEIYVTDAQGKVIRRDHYDTFTGAEVRIIVAPGVYHVHICTTTGQRVLKVVKE